MKQSGPFRVLVTGSRTWADPEPIHTALSELRKQYRDRLVVVHGACPRGADAIADAWCHQVGVQVERHAADWQRHGRSAGPRRNAAMVATRPALCLAYILGQSPGATGCVDLADTAGIPIVPTRRVAPVVTR